MPHASQSANIPELLAPGAGADGIRAAVASGADAVYFGLSSGFNARARAANVSPEALPETVKWLHDRGVRAYVAFNTLVFTEELKSAEHSIREAISAGVDALIVQDLGIARLIREISPDIAIHASTQMTLSCAESIRTVESLDIQRVILPRELTVEQISALGRETNVELEVFVHGALCISFGGQCLASAAIGGRSANRGKCAQACRLPYEAILDGQPLSLGPERYLLSPRDLAGWRYVPALVATGVASLKIEGRLKSPEYVAFVTRLYRQAIDSLKNNQAFEPTDEDLEAMEQLFSRGFCDGWLGESTPHELVDGRSSANRGVTLGRVETVRRGRISVVLERPIRRGDGVAFVSQSVATDESEDSRCDGGRIYEIFLDGQSVPDAATGMQVELALARDSAVPAQLESGDLILKTDDVQLGVGLRRSFQGEITGRQMPLDLEVHARTGHSLQITGCCGDGLQCQVESDEPLEEAKKHPLTEDVLRRQMERLGGTAYQLRELKLHMVGRPMVPLSVLGAMRRKMIRQLDLCTTRTPATLHEPHAADRLLEHLATAQSGAEPDASDTDSKPHAPCLYVLCRHLDQIDAALRCGVRDIFLDLRDRDEIVEGIRRARSGNANVFLATPRVEKPGDAWSAVRFAEYGADGLLARHLAASKYCIEHGIPFITDASLNATNPLTVDFLHSLGAARVTTSHDLSRMNLLALTDAIPAAWLEVVIHQHMPMFFMDYCLFRRLQSDSDQKCNRQCDFNSLRLRDRRGKEHPVAVDANCRCTVFSAVAQSAAEVVPTLVASGVKHFRVELLADTTAKQTETLLRIYSDLLEERITGQAAWKRLGSIMPDGLTRGTLAPPKENRPLGKKGARRK